MKKVNNSAGGLALISGSLLVVATMVFHPRGGSIEYLLDISAKIIVTHGLAIISVPFLLYGFWECYTLLDRKLVVTKAAFVAVIISLISQLIAAVLNGLVLPIFLNEYKDVSQEVNEQVTYLIEYNIAVNHAFDYLYIILYSIAILLFSVSIIRSKILSIWNAEAGFAIVGLGIIISLLHGQILSLHIFRILVLGLIGWTLMTGLMMYKYKA